MKININELSPRHIWLQNRIDECLDEIHKARQSKNIKEYQKKLKELVIELQYVSNEWINYYPE